MSDFYLNWYDKYQLCYSNYELWFLIKFTIRQNIKFPIVFWEENLGEVTPVFQVEVSNINFDIQKLI